MARDRIRLILLAVTCVGLALGQVPCKVNTTKFPPMACPVGSMCCPQPATPRCSDNPLICTVCAECCHDDLSQNATACANCAKAQCTDPAAYSDMGCRQPESSTCCGRGLPLNASRTLPNCLLIGDSVCSLLKKKKASLETKNPYCLPNSWALPNDNDNDDETNTGIRSAGYQWSLSSSSRHAGECLPSAAH